MKSIVLLIALVSLNVCAQEITDSIVGKPARLSMSASAVVGSPGGFGLDPGIGANMSVPFFYPFLHMDVSARISGRYLFAKDYQTDEFTDSADISNATTYMHRAYSQRSGVALIVNVFPTIYLKKFFFGAGMVMTFSYDNYQVRESKIALFSQDTMYSRTHDGGGLQFEQSNLIGVWTFGVMHKRFSAAVVNEVGTQSSIGIEVSYVLKEFPLFIGRR